MSLKQVLENPLHPTQASIKVTKKTSLTTVHKLQNKRNSLLAAETSKVQKHVIAVNKNSQSCNQQPTERPKLLEKSAMVLLRKKGGQKPTGKQNTFVNKQYFHKQDADAVPPKETTILPTQSTVKKLIGLFSRNTQAVQGKTEESHKIYIKKPQYQNQNSNSHQVGGNQSESISKNEGNTKSAKTGSTSGPIQEQTVKVGKAPTEGPRNHATQISKPVSSSKHALSTEKKSASSYKISIDHLCDLFGGKHAKSKPQTNSAEEIHKRNPCNVPSPSLMPTPSLSHKKQFVQHETTTTKSQGKELVSTETFEGSKIKCDIADATTISSKPDQQSYNLNSKEDRNVDSGNIMPDGQWQSYLEKLNQISDLNQNEKMQYAKDIVQLADLFQNNLNNVFDNFVCFDGDDHTNQLHRFYKSSLSQIVDGLKNTSTRYVEKRVEVLECICAHIFVNIQKENEAIIYHEKRLAECLLNELCMLFDSSSQKYICHFEGQECPGKDAINNINKQLSQHMLALFDDTFDSMRKNSNILVMFSKEIKQRLSSRFSEIFMNHASKCKACRGDLYAPTKGFSLVKSELNTKSKILLTKCTRVREALKRNEVRLGALQKKLLLESLHNVEQIALHDWSTENDIDRAETELQEVVDLYGFKI